MHWNWTQGPTGRWVRNDYKRDPRRNAASFNGSIGAATRDEAMTLAREACALVQANHVEKIRACRGSGVADLYASIRPLSGADVRLTLPQYASFGGGTILYLDRSNDVYCAACAAKRATWEEHGPITCGAFDEGSPEQCCACDREIESSYGDPDASDDASV